MNKVKVKNADVRREIAKEIAKAIQRKNPEWSLQQVNDAAYKAADLKIKRGEVRVS